MITYNMMKIAVDSVSKEFEVQIQDHIRSLKDYMTYEVSNLATKDVSLSFLFPNLEYSL